MILSHTVYSMMSHKVMKKETGNGDYQRLFEVELRRDETSAKISSRDPKLPSRKQESYNTAFKYFYSPHIT